MQLARHPAPLVLLRGEHQPGQALQLHRLLRQLPALLLQAPVALLQEAHVLVEAVPQPPHGLGDGQDVRVAEAVGGGREQGHRR